MNADAPWPWTDQRRREALRRLDVVDTLPEPGLDAALRLVVDLVGARVLAVSLFTSGRAWTKATTHEPVDVSREASFAQLAVDEPTGVAVVTVTDHHPLAAHPALNGLSLPVTCAAVVLPGVVDGPIGALEIVWGHERSVGADVVELLERVAAHAGHLLELYAETREYRRFIELSPDPVTVLDVDGTIVLANPALALVLGFAGAESLLGRAFLDLVDRHDRVRATSDLARVLVARDRSARMDLLLRRTDGEPVPCSVSAANLRGVRNHVQLTIHDLSDRLRGEDERTRLSEQLARAQRLDAVGQVAGGLAHDLNNLLVVMVSNLSLAEESLAAVASQVGSEPVATVRQDLDELRLAVDRAGRLTSKLLEFAQRPDGEHGTASVAEAIETVQRLFARSLGPGVALVLEVADGLPPVAADPIKLERALVNLVINARDAMSDGGTVRIVGSVASGVEDEEPLDRADPRPGSVLLEVIDDGRGMDQAIQARAFEPLFTTKGEGGSGLGLATVAAFADEVDGSVRLDSEPGEGTRVSLVLPVADPGRDHGAVDTDSLVGGAGVLLVDPGERTRRVIARMLRGAGYRVSAVGSAEEALRVFDEVSADLLITELSLPGMTGVRLLAEVQTRSAALRAVALATVDAPLMLDGIPVLVKPFSHARLLRAVEQVLQQG